jgi:hypothetical protein
MRTEYFGGDVVGNSRLEHKKEMKIEDEPQRRREEEIVLMVLNFKVHPMKCLFCLNSNKFQKSLIEYLRVGLIIIRMNLNTGFALLLTYFLRIPYL